MSGGVWLCLGECGCWGSVVVSGGVWLLGECGRVWGSVVVGGVWLCLGECGCWGSVVVGRVWSCLGECGVWLCRVCLSGGVWTCLGECGRVWGSVVVPDVCGRQFCEGCWSSVFFQSYFDINADDGTLTLAKSLDYETLPNFKLFLAVRVSICTATICNIYYV